TQGLFLEAGQKVAEEYAGKVEFEDKIVDATAMLLVMDPYRFDVLVMENMFGDILSDEIAGLVGGLGLAPGGNIGTDVALFEPVHGSAPDIAGKNIANPAAMILAACMMLDHMDDAKTANKIRVALEKAINKKHGMTPDLGGTGTTDTFAEAVIKELK
ncbi:MAG TPA: isocitrate/isopropylmalate family dehydrogenase, partial [Longimicrobiales bacterium]|nr:isocitrate/isopropylmalate family dehydrogenase [Longimicrobiales bacterium]